MLSKTPFWPECVCARVGGSLSVAAPGASQVPMLRLCIIFAMQSFCERTASMESLSSALVATLSVSVSASALAASRGLLLRAAVTGCCWLTARRSMALASRPRPKAHPISIQLSSVQQRRMRLALTASSCAQSSAGVGLRIMLTLTPLMPKCRLVQAQPLRSSRLSPMLTMRFSAPLWPFMASLTSCENVAAFQQSGWSGNIVSKAERALTMRMPPRALSALRRKTSALSCTQPGTALVTMTMFLKGSTRRAAKSRPLTLSERRCSSRLASASTRERSLCTARAKALTVRCRFGDVGGSPCCSVCIMRVIQEEHMSVSSQSNTSKVFSRLSRCQSCASSAARVLWMRTSPTHTEPSSLRDIAALR
mmetsp:Transcript_29040/g.92925  ORF Transcript_29040/g.92925 Transcript_29040/m.92925 type:complete len:365 (-) Transcript_29040:78-1172(-)